MIFVIIVNSYIFVVSAGYNSPTIAADANQQYSLELYRF
jgi:hypothetical protein